MNHLSQVIVVSVAVLSLATHYLRSSFWEACAIVTATALFIISVIFYVELASNIFRGEPLAILLGNAPFLFGNVMVVFLISAATGIVTKVIKHKTNNKT